MPPNGFGTALRKLRERRTLSVRELSTLAKLDHAYEYRLETSEKTNPSDEAMDKLIRALKPNDRDARMFRWLAEHPDTDTDFVVYALDDQSVTIEEFTAGAAMVHRGNIQPNPAKIIERVRRILSEEQ